MGKGMNKVFLFGNVGADPELRYTSNNTPVLHFNLATNEAFYDKNKALQERTEWHRIVLWGAAAEALSKVVTKGMGLLIEGWLRTSSYDRKGERRYVTEICARDVRITDRRPRLMDPNAPLDFADRMIDDMSSAATMRAPVTPPLAPPAQPAPPAPYAPPAQPAPFAPRSRSMAEEVNLF